MAEQVQQYKAEDGQVFGTMAEAEAHEAMLDREAEVDQYVKALGERYSERMKGTLKGYIMDWIAWENQSSAGTTES